MADTRTIDVEVPDETFLEELAMMHGSSVDAALTDLLDQAATQYGEAADLLDGDVDVVEVELPEDTITNMEGSRATFMGDSDEFDVGEMLSMILTAVYVRDRDSAAPA